MKKETIYDLAADPGVRRRLAAMLPPPLSGAEEHRARLSAALRKTWADPERRARMSTIRKAWWAQKKAASTSAALRALNPEPL